MMCQMAKCDSTSGSDVAIGKHLHGYPRLASISRRVFSLLPNFTPLFWRLSSSTNEGTGRLPPGAGPDGYPSLASISRLDLRRCPNLTLASATGGSGLFSEVAAQTKPYPLFCRWSSAAKLGTGTFPPGAGPAVGRIASAIRYAHAHAQAMKARTRIPQLEFDLASRLQAMSKLNPTTQHCKCDRDALRARSTYPFP